MERVISTDPFEYIDSTERRVLTLEPDGISCVPLLNYSHYKSCRPSVSEHIHPGCLECCFCLRGSLVFEYEGRVCHVLPGNVLVVQPGKWHRLSTNPKGLVMYTIILRMVPANRSLLHLPVVESKALRQALGTLPHTLFKGSNRLRLAFQELFKLYDDLPVGAFRSFAMRGAVIDLLIALIKAAQTEPSPPADDRLLRMVEDMRLHPERDYPLGVLMRETALSESHLNTRFKQATRLPPYNFLLDCRLRAVQRKLRETDESVTAIAEMYGFFSPQHLAVQFRRVFGITPSAWRAGQNPVVKTFNG